MTKNQHFKFGYSQIPFSRRQGPYFISFGACEREPLDFRSECLIAAKEIHREAKKPIALCLSGGMDSEIVALSFLASRTPFRAAILRFEKDLNLHDISWAIRFCETHHVPYDIYDFNVADFMSSLPFLRIAKDCDCLAPLVTVQIRFMEILSEKGFFPITGSSELILKKIKGHWSFFHQELIGSAFRYQALRGFEAQAGFFYWSPELIASFLLDPFVKRAILSSMTVQSSSELKYEFYSEHFQLEPRPKYRGYEKMVDLNEKYKEQLANHIPRTDEITVSVENLIEDLKIPKREPRSI